MNEITQATKELIAKFTAGQRSLKPREGEATIHVDEVASKVATFYEKIRTIIDWKEEHLMRRVAIMRKLKRRFLDLEVSNFTTENFAEPLLMELIRGGYFSNDKIEESKIAEIQRVIEKYVFILKNNPENKGGRAGLQFYNNLLEIAACEVEETLASSTKEMALIDYMFDLMRERIKINENVYNSGALRKEEKDVQIYIAVQQALFKLDQPIISYNLIKYEFSYWNNPSQDELLKLSQNIYKILNNIEKYLEHPLSKKFYAICEKYDTPYLLLGDILTQGDSEKINQEISDPILLESLIRGAYLKRLKNLKAKIRRAAVYSTVSIFITQIFSFITIEWALMWLFNGTLTIIFAIANIIVPTILMALLVIAVRPPSKNNLYLVIMETMKIVYKKEKTDIYEIKMHSKKGLMTRSILSLTYLAGTIISFSFIYLALYYLKFPVTSIIINTIFIAMILFAGIAIQIKSRELTIEEGSKGFLGFIYDILSLPVAGAGSWFAKKWSEYNTIVVLFNALIDMPFSAFVEFLERWRYFIKDKKEEIR